MERRIRYAEVFVSLLTIAIAALFLWDARRYTASPFEPVGSGAIPAGVAIASIVLGGLMLVQATRHLLADKRSGDVQELGLRVLAAFLLSVLYAVVLASGWVRYAFATAVFFVLAVLVLAERPKPLLPWTLGLGAVLGFGLDYIFRTVFVTNIP
jgi:TRAP-type C4-dicarboxylate transport system permease small subunit